MNAAPPVFPGSSLQKMKPTRSQRLRWRYMMSKATFHLGISGHQQLGDESTIQFVSRQFHDLLTTYLQAACDKGQQIVACSWELISFSSKQHWN
jgi:hypothetical protein